MSDWEGRIGEGWIRVGYKIVKRKSWLEKWSFVIVLDG